MNLLLNSNVSAIVDVVALVLIIAFALWGCIRGFVKTFFSAFGTILSLLIAILLAPSVANFLQDKFQFVDTVSNGINNVLTDHFGTNIMNLTLEQATKEHLANAGIAGFIVDIILSARAESSIPNNTKLSQIVCPAFAYYIVQIICIIGLFIIFKLIFRLVGDIAVKMHEKKKFARVDKTLGFALGVIHGIIILEFLIIGIKIIPIGFLQDIYAAIQTSIIAGTIEKISLFNLLIGAVTRSDVIGFITKTV